MLPYAYPLARAFSRRLNREAKDLIGVGLASTGSSLGLMAQTQSLAQDESLILNLFVVSAKQEEGYRASNSVSDMLDAPTPTLSAQAGFTIL